LVRCPNNHRRERSAVSLSGSSPLAVITGASSGIGRELAKQFAEHGYDVIVSAEDDELDEAAAEIAGFGHGVRAVRVDLSTSEGVDELWRAVQEALRPVDAIALNAGVGLGGDFATSQALEDSLRLVNLNVVSTVHLAKLALEEMARRGEGKVLFTSSIASMSPGPYQALYNASKSFIQSFAEAVRDELRDSGVTVTALMPGPTDTEFFERAGLEDTKLGSGEKADPANVAKDGFEALMNGKAKVVSGSVRTRVEAAAMRALPDQAKAAMHRERTKPGSAE
jgi:short-subunit dehydrogenase